MIAVTDPARSDAFYRDDPRARTPVAPGNSDVCFVWGGPIDGAVAHLRAEGVAVEAGPVKRTGAHGDGVSVYLRDPDGSLLELMSYERGGA